jgi:hypothetical protein
MREPQRENDFSPGPAATLPYRAGHDEAPSREQQFGAWLSGFGGGFIASAGCALFWWDSAIKSGGPVPRRPFDWRGPLMITLFLMAIVVFYAVRRKRAARAYRLGMLAGAGVVLLLQGLCFLAR